MVELFSSLGNEYCSSVWEAACSGTYRGLGAQCGCVWWWCTVAPSQCKTQKHAGARKSRCVTCAGAASKPVLTDPLSVRESFVVAKYVDRAFVVRPPTVKGPADLQQWLWEAVLSGNVRSAYHALACGADICQPSSSRLALQLLGDAAERAGGSSNDALLGAGHASVLHAACKVRGV